MLIPSRHFHLRLQSPVAWGASVISQGPVIPSPDVIPLATLFASDTPGRRVADQ